MSGSYRRVHSAVISSPRQTEASDLTFGFYASFLRRNLRSLLLVAASVVAVAVAYAMGARPVYETSMLIYVEETSETSAKNALSDLASMFETKKVVTAEMELIRSRAVITPVAQKLRLYINARPKFFPIVGPVLHRWRSPQTPSTPGLFGIGGYVWGSEDIEVPIFNVPDGMMKKDFELRLKENSEFDFFDYSGHILFTGKTNALYRVPAANGHIELKVSRAIGKPGASFLLTRLPIVTPVLALQKNLKIAEQGKQSGVIEVRLEGADSRRIKSVLQEIGQQYITQNSAHKSQEAEKSIAFLDEQLPKLKARLEDAETKFNDFRHASGTIDIVEESKLSLQRSATAKLRSAELINKRLELLSRFTPEHPIVQAVSNQVTEVNREIAEIGRHIKGLPAVEQDSVRLSRDIKINTELYTSLANTAQQLRVASLGTASRVRIVDTPVSVDDPTSPKRAVIIVGSLPVGLLCGIGILFLRRSIRSSVEDPAEIERVVEGLTISFSIPHSDRQVQTSRKREGHQKLLVREWPADPAVEALRSFRESVQYLMPSFDNNTLVIAGATSNLGKSFVAANFAAVMAAGGSQVLLIDGDVRKGRLHEHFEKPWFPGLYEVLTGSLDINRAIQRQVVENLDFLPTGSVPGDQLHFLTNMNLPEFFRKTGESYDIIIIDSPPILGLADTLSLGKNAGAIFLVARAGLTTQREIAESIKRLRQSGGSNIGLIFNDVEPNLSGYGYGYNYEFPKQLAYNP